MPHQPHPADTHDVIRITGARENNLRDIDLVLPKRRLTVFTGVSGSGKSSLVFATLAAESRRLLNETYSSFLQGFMPTQPRPDVDHLEGLTPAIVISQERLGANPRSTVGTVTDIDAHLRLLFSHLAQPSLGSPRAYSFNVASASGTGTVKKHDGTRIARSFEITGGMCPRCEGRGTVTDIDTTQLYDPTLSLREGALRVPGMSMDGWYGRIFTGCGYFDMDKPLGQYSTRELDNLLNRKATKITVDGINLTYEGLIPRIRTSMLSKDPDARQPHIRAFVDRVVVFRTCPECDGTRLTHGARSSRIGLHSIADVNAWPITDVACWAHSLEEPTAVPLLTTLRSALDAFVDLGLGYLTLDRPASTLSGGENQRVTMLRHLGSALTDITYIFDEPTIGLHPHDITRLNQLLLRLRDKGNTVLVIEHKPETITIADHVVDLGPGAGHHGGEITFTGTVTDLRTSDTLTGHHLHDRTHLKPATRTPTAHLELRNITRNNLHNVDVDIPLGVLTVITGVAGSGKSTLVAEALTPRDDVVTISQDPIKGSRRSNPATATGLLDPIRKAFAKANGVKPALFSPNSDGACATCKGAGLIYTDLGHLDTVETPCPDCDGRRFHPDVLDHHLGEASISDVLTMSVDAALEFFTTPDTTVPAAATILTHLHDVGLGYLTIGQPLTTLSGGERQRLKLATHLSARGNIIVLDEPTTGLHLADVAALLQLLDRLVDAGRTVIVVEHHQAVMAHADHIIDLGPGAGTDGGRIVFTGSPQKLVAEADTLTAQHLADYLDSTMSHNATIGD